MKTLLTAFCALCVLTGSFIFVNYPAKATIVGTPYTPEEDARFDKLESRTQTIAGNKTFSGNVIVSGTETLSSVSNNSAICTDGNGLMHQCTTTDTVSAGTGNFNGPIAVTGSLTFQTVTAISGGVTPGFTSNVGPTGSHTTVQKWLPVISAGTTYYVPMF